MSDRQLKNQEDRIKKLIDDLKNEDPDVRYTAAWALGSLGIQATPALSALIETLKDDDLDVAQEAAWALAKIGKKSKS